MDFDDILESPAFWVLSCIGIVAFIAMLVILKGMGQGNFMPWWIKIVVVIAIPVIAALFSGYAEG